MPAAPPLTDPVCLAAVAAAHGVRGALKLRAFTQDPLDVAAYGPLYDRAGNVYPVRVLHGVKGGVVAELGGVHDRNAAGALRGLRLYVPRAALPAADDDEWYANDLIGLRVVAPDGTALGKVAAVQDFGAGDVIAWRDEAGREGMVPFTRAHVPDVDVAAGRLVIVPDAGEAGP